MHRVVDAQAPHGQHVSMLPPVHLPVLRVPHTMFDDAYPNPCILDLAPIALPSQPAKFPPPASGTRNPQTGGKGEQEQK